MRIGRSKRMGTIWNRGSLSDKWINILLTCMSGFLFAIALTVLAMVNSTPAMATENMTVSYTPSYNTQYSVTVPSSLRLNANGSQTTVTFTIDSWSDFPSDKILYCDLAASNDLLLTNGSAEGATSIGMIVKHDSTVVAAGDRISTFKPTSLNGSDSVDFVVLTVEPESKPFSGGTYTGTLSFSCGIEGE